MPGTTETLLSGRLDCALADADAASLAWALLFASAGLAVTGGAVDEVRADDDAGAGADAESGRADATSVAGAGLAGLGLVGGGAA
jgi:hypothetical protein